MQPEVITRKILIKQIYFTNIYFDVIGYNFSQTNIKLDEIDIMNIINDNTFNLHNSFLDNANRYMKVILKCKLIGVAM